jgi:putative FmdB family regulatory protein
VLTIPEEVEMPNYVYECAKCGDEFELFQSFSDEPLKKHPGCGGKVAKVFQPVGIVLKGSGFYKNDNRGNGNGKRAKSDSTKSDSMTKSDSSSDSGSSTKSESSSKKSETTGTKSSSRSSTSSS